ncbi:hypothetical protein HRU45_01925 [Candidatus Dependentiae bacterium]|nr:hypothetical protein [Candidatus Dependentiae bacterium]
MSQYVQFFLSQVVFQRTWAASKIDTAHVNNLHVMRILTSYRYQVHNNFIRGSFFYSGTCYFSDTDDGSKTVIGDNLCGVCSTWCISTKYFDCYCYVRCYRKQIGVVEGYSTTNVVQ